MSCDSIPNAHLLPKTGVKKGWILFYFIKDPKIYTSLFFCYDATFKFEDVALATEETQEKVQSFLTLLEAERFFRLEQPSFQEILCATVPMSTCKDSFSVCIILFEGS